MLPQKLPTFPHSCHSETSKQVFMAEKSPLLPKKRDEEHATDGFNGASFTGAVFNLSTTIIGAGIMALPAAMKVLGLGLGIAIVIFVAVLTENSIEMLLRFSRAGKSVSYGGVMGDAFGSVGKVVLQICVLVNIVGVLIVYMIIIGDVLSGTYSNGLHHSGVLEGWFGEHWWCGRTFVLLVTTLAVFAPLACFKRIDSLRFTSASAVALAVVFVFITAGIVVVKLVDGSVTMPRLLPDVTDITSVWKLFTVVPVLVTAYVCHFNVHTIVNELADSSLIQPVVRTSLVLCSGRLHNDKLFWAPPICYALHLMLVFPIIFYPLRLNLDGLLFPSARPLVSDNRRFTLISIGLISLVFLGANFIPSIWAAFQFTGATATVCLGFIFPAAIALRDPHGIATKKDKILSIFMIGLAVFSNSVAIYSDAYAIFKMNVFPRA
ncbi:hypothetical protein L1049_005849 [Liquidambar formosana]|uniref:Amino acid transporter transmembrane domain-containing protein n=1 Tax=Liquidambar formosana TaxID=63359 RepID=A0AAP0RFH1_LIQFO